MNLRTTTILLTSIGLFLVLVGVVVLFIPKWVVDNTFPLLGTPSSDTWRRWQQPQQPQWQQQKQIKFYFFHVKNGAALKDGEAPVVQEMGPYVYRENVVNQVLGLAILENKTTKNDRLLFCFSVGYLIQCYVLN